MNKPLKVMFMGTPDFAVKSLKALAQRFDLCAVITQPDKPIGRKAVLTAPPVKAVALEQGIDVYQPSTLKDGAISDILAKHMPDLIVVAAYGKLLPKYVLDYPRYGCINVHGSLLPKYRGAAPIQRAIIMGEKETGVTIMQMAEGLDSGDILLKKSIDIKDDDTAETLFERLSVVGANALIEAIDLMLENKIKPIPQDDNLKSYAPALTKNEGELDFKASAFMIRRKVNGLYPWPCAYAMLKNEKLKIFSVSYGGSVKGAKAGEILAVSKAGIQVACGKGESVILEQVQKEGKKRMDAYSFAQGAKISIGDCFNS